MELLNHFIKSSKVAYKRVAYKKNLMYLNKSQTSFHNYNDFDTLYHDTLIPLYPLLMINRNVP